MTNTQPDTGVARRLTPPPGSHTTAAGGPRAASRSIPTVMLFVAGTLAVASAVHLSGMVTGRSALYDAGDAGIAEAVIGAVLLAGGLGMYRVRRHARTIGLAATGFATVGFLVGLTITSQAGRWPDIAYHLTILPILLASMVVLWRAGDRRAAR